VPRGSRRTRLAGGFEILASLFAGALGADEFGLHEDFFACGGTDADAARLAEAIHERYGFDVTVDDVRRHPTVAGLGSRLGTRRRRGAPLAVALGDRGSGTPIFFVAGGGGPAVQLHALADAFTSRPFFAIQARGLEDWALPDRRVPAFARRALREVRAHQPRGPYVLGGYSFGCLVAFEMACRLLDAGEPVALLVLLDTPAPPWATSRQVRRRTSRDARVMALKRSLRPVRRVTLGVVPRRGLVQYDRFYELSMAIGRRFRPGRQCAAPALVVRADVIAFFPDPAKAEPDIGWRRLLSGPVTCADAPGDHLSMIRRPHAEEIAKLVDGCLAGEPGVLRE
jgi:thioesterase domain-containing protein